MSLNKRQKEYIKKNINRKTIAEISLDTGLSVEEILLFLKKKWRKRKFDNFVSPIGLSKTRQPGLGFDFNLINFLIKNRLILFLFVGLILISYVSSLNNAFVSDDISGIALNQEIGNLEGSGIFSVGFIQKLAYFFIYHLFGRNPFYFRLINVVLHTGVSFLIFAIVSLMAKKRIAVITAVLFAVHPVLTESVTWISGGPYPGYSFFLLLAFFLYISLKENKKYWSIAPMVLAFNISEKAMVFPLILILWEFFSEGVNDLRKKLKKLAPFLIISAMFTLFYIAQIGPKAQTLAMDYYQEKHILNPFVQIPVAITSYLELIFWPQKLTLYHTEMSFSQANYIMRFFIFIFFLLVIGLGYKKNKYVFFWFSFFIVSLIPTLTPFGISWVVAERYVYLGSVGILAVIAFFIDKALEYKKFRKVSYSILFLVIFLLVIRTIARNNDWKNEDNLWFATVKVSPSGPNIHNNLGDVYGRQGDLEKAKEEFKKAIEIKPDYGDAYHNLANTYARMGDSQQAIENYEKAVSLNSGLWQSFQQLAAVYLEREDPEKAKEKILKAIEIYPENEILRQNLAVIEKELKDRH